MQFTHVSTRLELVKTVPKGRFFSSPLQFHHLVKTRTSVINEMIDRSGMRTHASADTAALTQCLRPLCHPVVKYRPLIQVSFRFCSGPTSIVKSVTGSNCFLQFAFSWFLLLIENQFTHF